MFSIKEKKILNYLIGDPDTCSVERRCFSACALASAITMSLILLTTLILSLSFKSVVLNSISTIAFVLTYILSRKKRKIKGLVWCYICLNILILSLDWFFLGGYTGMALPVAIALAGIVPIILNKKQLTYGVAFIFLYLFVLYIGARLFPEGIPQHGLDQVHLNDRFVNIAIIALGFAILTNIVMTTYRKQRDELNDLIAVLGDKNEELVNAIREVESLASRLDTSHKEQQNIADELQAANVFLDSLFESMPIPIFYKDQSLVFRRVNTAFCTVLGIEKQDMLGKRVDEIRSDVQLYLSQKTDKQALESPQIQTYETKMKYVDGLDHHVIISKNQMVDKDGQVLGLVGSVTDITERRIREEQIRYFAHHDILTGLYNRVVFNADIEKKLAKAKRKTKKLALLLLDLDGFKKVNDTLGHDAGDATLKEVGKRLKNNTREYDTVCRLGGDEFAIILDDTSQVSQVTAVANKILEALTEDIFYQDKKCEVSGSIGIAMFPDSAFGKEPLLKASDEAMYKAKSLGKNQYYISDIISTPRT